CLDADLQRLSASLHSVSLLLPRLLLLQRQRRRLSARVPRRQLWPVLRRCPHCPHCPRNHSAGTTLTGETRATFEMSAAHEWNRLLPRGWQDTCLPSFFFLRLGRNFGLRQEWQAGQREAVRSKNRQGSSRSQAINLKSW